jgi:hypothetical protein
VKPLARGNAFVIELEVFTRDSAGEFVPAYGLTGGTGWIAAEKGGPAIDAALQVALDARVGKPHSYYGTISGSDIDAHLVEGQLVWVAAQFSPDILEWEPREVVNP